MEYVIIEHFNGTISLDTDMDGNVRVFEDLTEAKNEAVFCQCGIVVPLTSELMNIIEEAAGLLDVCMFELGEFEKDESYGDEPSIEDKLNGLLG